ncbi:Eco47II family restriction endonuclease [Psittacicella hinzii]|uniref:Eco47II family restriction endonuclease n=1 Tax=Psittacicella hinzii TaxID=2028575 RepID=UPI001CA6DBFE|nr:Eco47II family restriction endonuclease [Psittacicella hinzii]
MDQYDLDFIDKDDFDKHVLNTLNSYNQTFRKIDLKEFNKNLIDPIKLIFDKHMFKKSYEEIIDLEIHRQRDKSNNNIIGFFHQNIFKYINSCEVPNKGGMLFIDPKMEK